MNKKWRKLFYFLCWLNGRFTFCIYFSFRLIVIRYIYTQDTLEKKKVALNQSQEELTNKNEVLDNLNV